MVFGGNLGADEEVFQTRVDRSGRIVLPAGFRAALGVVPGDAVLLVRDDAGVHVETPEQASAALRAYFRALAPPGVSLADELIAERRLEAERE